MTENGRFANRPYASIAPVYDALFGRGFHPLLVRSFERLEARCGLAFRSAADAACGTGSFARYLAGRGARPIFGVDASPAMLGLARERSRGWPVRFLQQDLRALRLPEAVDLITCNFDSLNYLLTRRDLAAALRGFAENLRPGGAAVFDLITKRPSRVTRRPVVQIFHPPGGLLARVLTGDPASGLQRTFIRYQHHGNAHTEAHLQRGWSPGEVADLLPQAGLVLAAAHDFLSLAPPEPGSWRVAYACVKNALIF